MKNEEIKKDTKENYCTDNIAAASDNTKGNITKILDDMTRFLDESKLERQQEKEWTEKYIKKKEIFPVICMQKHHPK